VIAILLAALAIGIGFVAHRRAAVHTPATLERARRVFAAALVAQTGILLFLRHPPAVAIAHLLLVLAAVTGLVGWWALVTLMFVGTRRRDLVLRLPLLIAAAIIVAANGSGLAAGIVAGLGGMAFRWKSQLSTARLFRLALLALVLAVIGFWGIGVPGSFRDGLTGPWRALWNFARATRWLAAFHATAGSWALLAAFVKDPSLGVRTVGRRLALSHVLVVVIPMLLTGLLWIATTVLGVGRDRALVAARAIEGESDALESSLRAALAGPGDVSPRLAALGRLLEHRSGDARVWRREGSELVRVFGDSTASEAGLIGWLESADSLPASGVVTRHGRWWLGAAVRDDERSAIVLVPADSIVRSVVTRVTGAETRLLRQTFNSTPSRGRTRAERDSIRRVLRDSIAAISHEAPGAGDSAELVRARRIARRFGIPDTLVHAGDPGGGRSRARLVTGDQSFEADTTHGAGFLLDGYALARGVREASDGRWRSSQALVAVHIEPRRVLAGLFENRRRDQFAYLPLVLLCILAASFLVVALFDVVMVAGMGRGVTTAIGALHDGARRMESGELAHRIEVRGDDDLWDVARAFNQAAAGLERAREAEKERERIESELALARRIQARLLPDAPPQVPGLEIAGASGSAREVGGDYFDHIDLGGGRVVVVIADVSGKGVGAALLMSAFRAALLSADLPHTPVAQLATRLNGFLHRSVEPGRFVTAFVAFVDAASGAVQYVNAGHNPPLVLRADGTHEWLSEGGTILGILPESPFAAGATVLGPGDLVALYTDGVTEGADATGAMWGEERLVETVRRLHDRPAAEMVRRIVAEVRAFEGETGPADDITMLVVRRLDPATPLESRAPLG
jgi:serine phosphatase RsbU (regulator of sigma subunit)